LNDLKLKVTPPIEFNDPFEFMPRMDHAMDPATFGRWLLDPDGIAQATAVGEAALWRKEGLNLNGERSRQIRPAAFLPRNRNMAGITNQRLKDAERESSYSG
jgi:hypothetical protein